MDPDASNFVSAALSENSDLIDAQVLASNTSLQRGLHRGGANPSLPLDDRRNFLINLDNDGFQEVALPAGIAASTVLADVAAAIETAVRALGTTKKKASTPIEAFNAFTCTVEGAGPTRACCSSRAREQWPRPPAPQSSVLVQNAPAEQRRGSLRLGESNGGVSQDALAVRTARHRRHDPAGRQRRRRGGHGGLARLGGERHGAVTTFSNAFRAARQQDRLQPAGGAGRERRRRWWTLGMAYCANRPLQDVFYVGEMADDDTAEDAAAFRTKLTKANSYGAVYFPWVKALDPTGAPSNRSCCRRPDTSPGSTLASTPPAACGKRRLAPRPASTEWSGWPQNSPTCEHGNLNPLGVNVLRRFAVGGYRGVRRPHAVLGPRMEVRPGTSDRDTAARQHLLTASNGRCSSRTTSRCGRSCA